MKKLSQEIIDKELEKFDIQLTKKDVDLWINNYKKKNNFIYNVKEIEKYSRADWIKSFELNIKKQGNFNINWDKYNKNELIYFYYLNRINWLRIIK